MAEPTSKLRLSAGEHGGGGGGIEGGGGAAAGGGRKSPRNSGGFNSGLFLTLPSNFSPSSGSQQSQSSPTGSQKGSSGGGGVTPPTPQQHYGKGISRGSPSHNYTWEDLRRLFLISLEKMYTLEPESIPFRQPVDPEALGIPDYVDIIRRPMDLQTIRNKMSGGKYTDPWLYVDDVLRMLDNAWVYNREGSKVSQYCSRLAQVFQKEVNPVMNHLGYKQGRTNPYQFNSDTVTCNGRPVCLVEKGGAYWKDCSRNIEYNLCEQCYQQQQEQLASTPSSADSTCSSSVTPDVIPNTPNHQHHHHQRFPPPQPQGKCSKSPSSSPRGSISSIGGGGGTFEFCINSSKGSYSPAAELHKSHMRDAEMSRQLVLREFLRMLLASETSTERKQNVFKMLSCNGKLMGEFVEYVKRRRNIVMSGGKGSGSDSGGCRVVIGESFTTKDLDVLLEKLKGIKVNNGSGVGVGGSGGTKGKINLSTSSNDDAISVSSSDKENDEIHDTSNQATLPMEDSSRNKRSDSTSTAGDDDHQSSEQDGVPEDMSLGSGQSSLEPTSLE